MMISMIMMSVENGRQHESRNGVRHDDSRRIVHKTANEDSLSLLAERKAPDTTVMLANRVQNKTNNRK